jgi:hypothetical protein
MSRTLERLSPPENLMRRWVSVISALQNAVNLSAMTVPSGDIVSQPTSNSLLFLPNPFANQPKPQAVGLDVAVLSHAAPVKRAAGWRCHLDWARKVTSVAV